MCEPISIGAIFASIGSAFKFADFAIRVAEVGSENEVFVRTIRVVRDDLHEVERLLNADSVRRKLTGMPGKLPWIRGAVLNTKSALNEIGRWVERARSEQESTGTIQFETRVRWVFNDHEKLINRKTELMTCHQQLSNVLGYLIRLEDIPTISEPPDYTDTTFFDDILSRHNRKTIFQDPKVNLEQCQISFAPVITEKTERMPQDLKSPLPYSSSKNDSLQSPDISYASSTMNGPGLSPCSPPPTYSSVVDSSNGPRNSHPHAADSSSSRVPVYNLETSKARGIGFEGNGGSAVQQHTWAYEYTSKDIAVPELAGDAIFMSGTNSMGPVNPFEFTHAVSTKPDVITRKENESGHPAELLGDFNFAVELPANDLTQIPGHLSMSTQRPVLRPDDRLPGSRMQQHENGMFGSERSAVPRYRPIPIQAKTDPGTTLQHDTNLNQATRSLSSDPSQKTLIYGSHGVNAMNDTSKHMSDPPSLSRYRAIPRRSLPGHNYRDSAAAYQTPRFSTEVGPMSISSPNPCVTNAEHHGSRSTTEVANGGVGYTPLQPVNSASSARMRRQKDMMDFLGSLGT